MKVYQKIIEADKEHRGICESGELSKFFDADSNTFYLAQLRLVAISLATGKPIPIPDIILKAGKFPDEVEKQANRQSTNVRLELFS